MNSFFYVFLFFLSFSLLGQQIGAYEYWYDDNYSGRNYVDVTPTDVLFINNDLLASQLYPGIHAFNFRARATNGLWSSIISTIFYKIPPLSNPSQNIWAYQYWFDDDYNNAVTVSLPPQSVIFLSSDIDAASLLPGLHTFSIRFKDNLGQWSPVVSSFFYKISGVSTSSQHITTYQYWFDDDYNNNVTETISPVSNLLLDLSLPVGSLNNGLHTISFRFRDNTGMWSSVVMSAFVKIQAIQTSQNTLLAYRYWFDDEQIMHFVPFSSPISGSVVVIDNIDMTAVEKGQHILYIQFLDSLGQWSVPLSNYLTKLSLPVARFTYNSDFYCDSTIVHFINQSTDGDIYMWYINGQLFSTDKNPSHSFIQPGTYHVSLFIQDTSNFLDSTISHIIEIKGKTYAEIYEIACDTFTSPSGNYAWHLSGEYYDTLSNTLGCDSIIVIHLTINNSTSAIINPVVCDSFVSPSGQFVWYSTGIYADVLSNAVGCDSVMIIHLTVVDIDTSVGSNGQVLWANMSNASYQWYRCDSGILIPLSNALDQSYEPAQSGYYAVIVSSQGCSDTSSCHYFDVTYLNNFDNQILIYPNPAENFVNIRLNEPQVIEIFSIEGNCVLKTEQEVSLINISLHSLNKGFYLIKPVKQSKVYKLIKL